MGDDCQLRLMVRNSSVPMHQKMPFSLSLWIGVVVDVSEESLAPRFRPFGSWPWKCDYIW